MTNEMRPVQRPASNSTARKREQLAAERAAAVDQTILAADPVRQGNCLAACVATYLGITLEEVPHFGEYDPEGEPGAWWHLLVGFMAAHGLWPVKLDDPSEALPGEAVFVVGPGPRGVMHQVIYRDGVLWHDPHPSRAGLLGVAEVIAWRSARHDHTPTED